VKLRDGTTKVMTQSEVQQALDRAEEKERGFDKKFRDLSEVRKGAEYNERVVADMAAAQRGDLDAMKRLATYPELGVTQEAVNQTLEAYEKQQQEASKPEGGGREVATEELEPLDIGDFTPEMQKMFRDLKNQKDKGTRERVFGNLDSYLDKDEVLGGIITDERSPEALVKRTREYAREVLLRRAAEAQRRGDATWAPGPVEFQRVAQDVRSWLDDVASIRGEASGDAGERASGSIPGMGRSPGSRLESLHRAKEPPKRETSRDDGVYKVSLRERLQYAMENKDGDNFGD